MREDPANESDSPRPRSDRPRLGAWFGVAMFEVYLILQFVWGWERTGTYRIDTFAAVGLIQVLLIAAVVTAWRRHRSSVW